MTFFGGSHEFPATATLMGSSWMSDEFVVVASSRLFPKFHVYSFTVPTWKKEINRGDATLNISISNFDEYYRGAEVHVPGN